MSTGLNYVASILAPSATLGALALPDFLPHPHPSPILVVNKLNHLEFYSSSSAWQAPPDHSLLYDLTINGSVLAIEKLHLPGQPTASLLVLTSSNHLFALTHDPSAPSPSIVTTSTVSVHEDHARLSEFATVIVDPLARCILVHIYNGLLRVIPLVAPVASTSSRRASKAAAVTSSVLDLSKGYTLRLPQLNLTSLTFLPSAYVSTDPTIALISYDSSGNPVLHSYAVGLAEKELLPGPTSLVSKLLQDPGSEVLIPVGGAEMGLVVVGEEWIAWLPISAERDPKEADDAKSKVARGKRRASSVGSSAGVPQVGVKTPVGAVKSWTAIQGSPDQFLLGDLYGKLSHLSLVRNSAGKVTGMTLLDLGDTSSSTALLSLTPTVLFVASRFADSQFVRLPNRKAEDAMAVEDDGEEEEIQLLGSFPSLAPILDCCLVQAEGGTTSIVTCSGAYKGGSLRVVRQGVGLTELANLDMEGIRQIWSLRKTDGDLLVLSFFTETKILAFSSSEGDEGDEDFIEEIEIPHFNLSAPTIFAFADGDSLVQVTSDGVRSDQGDWKPEGGKKITLATAIQRWLVCILEGGDVVLLQAGQAGLTSVASTTLANEIASLSTNLLCGNPVIVIGLWTSQSVVILSLPSLSSILTQDIPTTYLIRSVQVLTFADSIIHLFVGLGDGTLVSYIIEEQAEGLVVKNGSRKTVVLGRQPILMVPFEAKEVSGPSLFVSSDRPTIVSRVGDRLKYSSVNLKGITAVVPFSTKSFPSSLALASPAGLRIGRIQEIQSVDIRTIPLGDDEPRRIAYDAKSDTFGVVCLRREIDRMTGEQDITGSFKVVDAKSFEVLSSTNFDPDEQGESVAVVPTSGDATCYVVGTSQTFASEAEPSSGRLLVIAPSDGGRDFSLRSRAKINGCPYALTALGVGHLAAAIQSQVIAFGISLVFELTNVAAWSGKFISLTLSPCADSTLLVGDGIGSLTLLRFSFTPVYKLEELARDHRTLYVAAAAPIDLTSPESEYIGAEAEFNMFTVKSEDVTTARSMADERALSPRGVFHLGELVSRFCHGSFVQQYGDASGIAVPRLVFATSAGSLGIVAEVDSNSSKILADLERNMRGVVRSVGDLDQEEWRAFKSDTQRIPSAGFLDGNFLELFATLSPADVDAVLAGASEHETLTLSGAALLKLVDDLARLH